MNTNREADYTPTADEIAARMDRVRTTIESRRHRLPQLAFGGYKTEEQCQIELIDSLLAWLEFGGTVPEFIAAEESLQPNEKIEVLL